MSSMRQMTIDGNEVTFEIKHRSSTDSAEHDNGGPVIAVTTVRDGQQVWCAEAPYRCEVGVPIDEQLTADQMEALYRHARWQWYASL